MKSCEIKGIIPPILTPMNNDPEQTVNHQELRNQVERLLRGGVHGLFPFGTNGEGYILSLKEKEEVLETVIDQVKGRVPVYAGTGCISTADTVRMSKRAEELGADVLSIITPSFALASQKELYDHYVEVAKHVNIPIVLYNIPMRTGNKLLPETVEKLARDVDVIMGAKDSSGDRENLKAYIDRTRDLEKPFSVLAGNDGNILYCLENGGTVLNAAILLDGKMPVEVKLKRLDADKIVFDSRDMDSHGEFDSIEELQSVGDPYDPFVLQKAALLAAGILPAQGGNLKDVLHRLGGGILMSTEVVDVPKGSGLGTSSILAGACVKALFEFCGIPYTEETLYSHVSVMEQIMSTGGGWQDQVGGLSGGVKYIRTMPGLQQNIQVEHLRIPQEAWEELKERFVLIYTGQRRLARNLLRDVVGRYIGNEPDSLYAHNEIQRTAALMRFELERGHIDDFAKLMDAHWKLSQMIDAGSSNTLIDQIFAAIDEYVDGRLVCGAGGGGFLQVVLKKGVSRQQVHARLKEVFQDSDVDVYNATLM